MALMSHGVREQKRQADPPGGLQTAGSAVLWAFLGEEQFISSTVLCSPCSPFSGGRIRHQAERREIRGRVGGYRGVR